MFKPLKKHISIATLVLLCLPGHRLAGAAEFFDGSYVMDAGDTFETANRVQTNTTVQGEIIGGFDTNDRFTFTPAGAGTVTIKMDLLIQDFDLYLYDSNRNEISKSIESGDLDEVVSWPVLAGEKYYVEVRPYQGAQSIYRLAFSLSGETPIIPPVVGPVVPPVMPPTPTVSSDRVFAYAEGSFGALFSGSPVFGVIEDYTYRYYPQSRNYLGIDSRGGVYILGPSVGNSLTHLGSISDFQADIERWETSPPVSPTVPGNFSLATSIVGGGVGRITPAQGSYAPGTSVDVSVVPDFFSDFVGWTNRTTQPTCVGVLFGCRMLMSQNQLAEAKVVPTSFVTDFDGTYPISRRVNNTDTCRWNVTFTNSKIKITKTFASGNWYPEIRISGTRSSIVDSSSTRVSNCNGAFEEFDIIFTVPGLSESTGISGRFRIFSGVGEEFLTVRAALPGPPLSGALSFLPAEVSLDYTAPVAGTGFTTFIKMLSRVPQQ